MAITSGTYQHFVQGPGLLMTLAGLLVFTSVIMGQERAVVNALSFGAKGDGKTDNTAAFNSINTYIKKAKGNVALFFPKGIYLVGKQKATPEFWLDAPNAIELTGVTNVKISGEEGAVLKYNSGMHYGSFDTQSKKPLDAGHNFFDKKRSGRIGSIIHIENCRNILIQQLELHGNDSGQVRGGTFGDIDVQLPYNGIFIRNSSDVTVSDMYAHHFGLDGIQVSNQTNKESDKITIRNSRFYYNGRQGLSWVGGNQLLAENCSFSHTGKGAMRSLPASGVDLEAEVGPIRNGRFVGCVFENNTGAGVVSATGDNADCTFESCTFWGVTSYSTWVTKPAFTYSACRFYGMVQHGFAAKNEREASRYINCHFSDSTYNGTPTWGGYLIDANDAAFMQFDSCTFTVTRKKPFNLSGKPDWPQTCWYQMTNCLIEVKGRYNPGDDFSTAAQCLFTNSVCRVPFFLISNQNYIYGLMPKGKPKSMDGLWLEAF
ncbi:right-handed parallel beta-helix repeat-containing protein [Phnomibacter sp. MR]|uniref:right-handed parallel beta-helix repeat-containing protein n=1 Tax=Phnomibacter sp. MR TaxID=3042318 RepID=UPI003A800DE2